MEKITLDLPTLFADHHVIEVRRILQSIAGVEDIYASSCFHIVEVSYDPARVNPGTIKNRLDEAGYLRDLPVPTETWQEASERNSSGTHFRHTAVYTPTGVTVGFAQKVAYTGRPLWPCPGVGTIEAMDEGD